MRLLSQQWIKICAILNAKVTGKNYIHSFKFFRYCIAHSIGATNPRDQNRFLKEKKISEDMVKEIVEKTRKGESGGPLSFITDMLEAQSSTSGEYVKLSDFLGHCITIMVPGMKQRPQPLAFCWRS